MARIQAGSTLVNQYAPPFVVSDSVAQGWELQWNDTLQAFEAVDPNANVIAAGFDVIESALFENVTQQVFVVPWASASKASLLITIDGVKQQQDAYTILSDTASNTTTITLSDTVSNETVEIIGLQTTGGASVELYGPINVDSNVAGTVNAQYILSWFAPTRESLIVTVDGVKQNTSSYTVIPEPNSGYTQTRLSFPDRTITFGTDAAGVNTAGNFITTDTPHGFADGDGVYYSDDGGIVSVGLTDGGLYYVNSITAFTLSLHTTRADALIDANRVSLTASGTETHAVTLIAGPYLSVNPATIVTVAGGAGYAPGNTLAITGGTPVTEAVITVDTVDGGGAITSFTLSNIGEYVVFPSPNPVSTTTLTGGGAGATFNIFRVSPKLEVIGITTTGETPASPVEAANLVEPDTAFTFGLFDSKTVTNNTQVLNFKSLNAGSNVTLADGGDFITINAEVQRTINQVGSGTSLFNANDEDAEPLVFRRITGGDGIGISVVADTITVSVNREYVGISTADSPYAAGTSERFIGINNVSGPIVITLPAAAVVPGGEVVAIKDETGSVNGVNTITLQTPGAELIDGAATYTINTSYGFVELYSNGTNYYIISAG